MYVGKESAVDGSISVVHDPENENCVFYQTDEQQWKVVVEHGNCGGPANTLGARSLAYRNSIWLNINHSSLSIPQVRCLSPKTYMPMSATTKVDKK